MMPSLKAASTCMPHLRSDRAVVARRIASAAASFEQGLLGRVPQSVSVVSGRGFVVVTIHTALSDSERLIVSTAEGYRRLTAWHRSLTAASFEAFREHVARATGLRVAATAAHLDLATHSLLKTCSTAAAIDVVVLGGRLPEFGIAVDEHLHVDATDGTGSVRFGNHPKGLSLMTEVPHAGAYAEESRERGDRSA